MSTVARILRKGGLRALTMAIMMHLENRVFTISTDEALKIRREIGAELFANLSGYVQSGYARGMRLQSKAATWSEGDFVSYLLGYYEEEVQAELARLSQRSNGTFIDIGAATGYYAVSSLFNNHFERVVAFEMDSKNRETIKSQANLNGVSDRITLRGEFTDSSLYSLGLSLSGAVILMDVEGAEFDILTPQVIQQLCNSHLVLEVHGWTTTPERLKRLREELEQYFVLKEIRSGSRDPSHPLLDHFRDDVRWLLVSEGRHERGTWWSCSPRLVS